MIVPIVKSVKGEDQMIGTARVLPEGEVEFYLNPGFSMAKTVMAEMTKQLKKLARKAV